MNVIHLHLLRLLFVRFLKSGFGRRLVGLCLVEEWVLCLLAVILVLVGMVMMKVMLVVMVRTGFGNTILIKQ